MIIQKDLEGNIIAQYKNKSEAARILGLNESSIRRAVTQNRTVHGKFKFVKVNDISEVSINKSKAKILFLDIETAPIRAYTWGLWQQNIYLDQIISNWFMISWSAKWLGEQDTMSDVLTPDEIINEDDERLMQNLWTILDEAQIVVAHNGKGFDIPKITTRFLVHNMPPPSPYRQIDTKEVSKNTLNLPSNKLEALARLFGFEGKYDTDFELWADCMKGDVTALLRMEEYNNQDVRVLEKVYIKLRPYMKNHPNLDLFDDKEVITCPHCGSESIELKENKYFYTQSVKYQLYTCKDCGAHSRGKKGIVFMNKKQISAIPR